MSSPELYHLSYSDSIDGTDLNLLLESNAMQGVLVCYTICHQLKGELSSDVLNQIDKWKQIYNLCTNYKFVSIYQYIYYSTF